MVVSDRLGSALWSREPNMSTLVKNVSTFAVHYDFNFGLSAPGIEMCISQVTLLK